MVAADAHRRCEPNREAAGHCCFPDGRRRQVDLILTQLYGAENAAQLGLNRFIALEDRSGWICCREFAQAIHANGSPGAAGALGDGNSNGDPRLVEPARELSFNSDALTWTESA
ncbi:MAG TPA: hypothetical protein VEO01_05735 [Pseudonocardiaceae bacterium]|nr:hypothetical protein [Pseudonocardiaceae bacterium]